MPLGRSGRFREGIKKEECVETFVLQKYDIRKIDHLPSGERYGLVGCSPKMVLEP